MGNRTIRAGLNPVGTRMKGRPMTTAAKPGKEPGLLNFCAAIAVLGSISLIAGNVVGSLVVPGHNWVSDTVSDLAAGRYEIIQDVALYGYAGALVAAAIGAAHSHSGGWQWSVGIFGLTLLALCVVVIGARNEYGDNDNEGVVIHIYVVYALGVLFTATFLAMAKGLGRHSRTLEWLSYICAGLWSVGAVIFFLLPTDIDGIWERGLGIITVVWVCAFAVHLRRMARS